MKLETLHFKNFRVFQDVVLEHIPNFCVLVGANGTGKSTVFCAFDFLKAALAGNVNSALAQLGGSRGLMEVRSRGASGPIELELQFRKDADSPLATYFLQISEHNGRAFVAREILKCQSASADKVWHLLDFVNGKGKAITNETDLLDKDAAEKELTYSEQSLKSNDLLALKGLAQFADFPLVASLGNLIENWQFADFRADRACQEQPAGDARHLSREGENLSLYLQYLYQEHRQVFEHILEQLGRRIPGLSDVTAKTTEDGRVLLKFQDGSFEDPFLARYVSQGTIKMLAYLALLNDPFPQPMICVEEPENQLYPSLLWELAEEFRLYANRGGQVMVSTHSPDFLNAARLEEVFWLVKKNGYSTIRRAVDDPQIAAYMADGDQMGYLWKQGLFQGADP